MAMRAWVAGVLAAAVLAAVGPGGTAAELPFGSRARGARAAVTAHGMDLFVIASGAGGYSAAQRAQVVAARLNERLQAGDLEPDRLRVASRRGEVVLEYRPRQGEPQPLLTVDRKLAAGFPGSGGSRVRIAHWWLALLKDHLLLSASARPRHSLGGSRLPALGLVYDALHPVGAPPAAQTGPAEVGAAVARVARQRPDFRKLYAGLGASVPFGFEEPLPETEDAAGPSGKPEEGSGPADPPDAAPENEGEPRVLKAGPEAPPASAEPPEPAPPPEPFVLDVPVSTTKRIRIGVAPGEEALVEWAGGTQNVRKVEFAALDAEGNTVASSEQTAEPFSARFDLQKEIGYFVVTTHYASGVVSSWKVPYLEPPEQGDAGSEGEAVPGQE